VSHAGEDVFQEKYANIRGVIRQLKYAVTLTSSVLPLSPEICLTFNCSRTQEEFPAAFSDVHQAQDSDFFSDSCNYAIHIFITEQIWNLSCENTKG